jgi:hypothetical protein
VAVLAPQASASASSATTASPSILKCGSRDCQMMGAERQLVCAKRDAAMDCLAQSANYRATSGLVSGLNGWLRGFGWGGGVGRGVDVKNLGESEVGTDEFDLEWAASLSRDGGYLDRVVGLIVY